MLIMVALEEGDGEDDDKSNTSKLHKDTMWKSSVSVCPGLFFLDGCFLSHPAGSSINSDCFWTNQLILSGFCNDDLEKIYLEAQIANQYNWIKDNTAQLSFILFILHDIHKFSNRK